VTTTLSVALFAATTASAAEQCDTVRFGQVNWTGVSAKTGTAAWLLNEIGYETDVITASLPIMFQSLANNERDVFAGFWVPTSRTMASKHMKKGDIDIVTKNLKGAKYTVGVTQAAWDGGVRHFSDLAENIDRFDGRILGIESGNDGNQIIQQMIADDAYGMSGFELQPSSEAGMLTEVQRRVKRGEWAAWLAWAPHPMNVNIDLQFLNGGADYWGPNQGGATVYTVARKGYAWECPNIGQFLENYEYTVAEQSELAAYIVNDEMDYAEAGQTLIRNHPELIERWFGQGGTYQTGAVKTADGEASAHDVIADELGL
jgi:glycine betaine/proline transport system substrate-binding protein